MARKAKGQHFPVWENVHLAFEALRDRGARSLLTMTGVFIGVVIIIGVASVLNGFREGVVEAFEQYGTDTIYVTRMPVMQMKRPDKDVRRRKYLSARNARALAEECSAIRSVSPALDHTWPTLKYKGEEMVGAILRGSWPDIVDAMSVELAQGRMFTEEECRRGAPVCVIGNSVLKALFPSQTALGRTVTAGGKRLRVIGVLAEIPSAFSFGDDNPDDSQVFMPLPFFRQAFTWPKEVWIVARAKEGQRVVAIGQIEEALRRQRGLRGTDDNDFETSTPDSFIEIFDKITGAAIGVMFALSTVAFLVGGVGVMNVMLASVKERTREIGVRRAIGARRRDIVWQFLFEAMVLTGIGGILGVVLGEALMQTVAALLPAVPCAVPMWARVFGFLGSVGVGLVFGLWPAVTAARLDPIDALRYE